MDYDRLRELQEKFEENPRRYFAPLANEYRKGGQPKRAIEICRVQLAQMPGHMSGQIVFGQALYEAGEFEEAQGILQRRSLDPENLIALRSLGDMSLQSGDTVQARSWYMRLLDADPKDTAVIALVSEIDASAEAELRRPAGIGPSRFRCRRPSDSIHRRRFRRSDSASAGARTNRRRGVSKTGCGATKSRYGARTAAPEGRRAHSCSFDECCAT
jgi:tetratricopeptide (TPR) repeat protein